MHVVVFPYGEGRWQLQVLHEANPTVTRDIIGGFNGFLAKKAADLKDDSAPKTLTELRAQCGMHLILSKAASQTVVPVARWRIAFYMVGDTVALAAAVDLFVDYVEYRVKGEYGAEVQTKPYPEVEKQGVRVHLAEGVGDVKLRQREGGAEVTTCDSLVDAPAQSVFEADSHKGTQKWLTVDIEIVSSSKVGATC